MPGVFATLKDVMPRAIVKQKPLGRKLTKLTSKEVNASKAIGKLLVKNNVYFAGVDFVQGKLIGDINVTSPTGLAAYKDLSGINLAKMFWDYI